MSEHSIARKMLRNMGIGFVAGACLHLFMLLKPELLRQSLDEGLGVVAGTFLFSGSLGLVAALLLTMSDLIKDEILRALFLAGGIFLITFLLITVVLLGSLGLVAAPLLTMSDLIKNEILSTLFFAGGLFLIIFLLIAAGLSRFR
jgi:hypothetical protein